MRKRKPKYSYKIKIEGKKQVIRKNTSLNEIEQILKEQYPLTPISSANILETYSKIRQNRASMIYILTQKVSDTYTRKILAYVKKL